MERKFGWQRDPEDKRDWKFKHVLKEIATELPPKVDLRSSLSAVEDQEDIGSCVANAVVGSMEYLALKRTQKRFLCFKQYKDLSRLFVYYNARRRDGCVEIDAGTTIRSAIKSLAEDGVCAEKIWPYDTSKWAERPPDKAYDLAEKRQIRDYYRAFDSQDIMQALALGFPVPFGAMITDDFMKVGGDGEVSMPSGQVVGGHAMLIVGYLKDDRKFIVRNSWGTRWGRDGYCYFPFDYIEDPGLSGDFWVIRS